MLKESRQRHKTVARCTLIGKENQWGRVDIHRSKVSGSARVDKAVQSTSWTPLGFAKFSPSPSKFIPRNELNIMAYGGDDQDPSSKWTRWIFHGGYDRAHWDDNRKPAGSAQIGWGWSRIQHTSSEGRVDTAEILMVDTTDLIEISSLISNRLISNPRNFVRGQSGHNRDSYGVDLETTGWSRPDQEHRHGKNK